MPITYNRLRTEHPAVRSNYVSRGGYYRCDLVLVYRRFPTIFDFHWASYEQPPTSSKKRGQRCNNCVQPVQARRSVLEYLHCHSRRFAYRCPRSDRGIDCTSHYRRRLAWFSVCLGWVSVRAFCNRVLALVRRPRTGINHSISGQIVMFDTHPRNRYLVDVLQC